MVKFGEEISRGRVNEWQPYYINYARLKGWIQEMERDKSESAREQYQEELRDNIRRVDKFYTTQEQRLHKKVMELPDETQDCDDVVRRQKGQDIKDQLDKLIDFAVMNFEGLRKITKKFDKKVDVEKDETEEGEVLLQKQTLEVLETYPFSNAQARLQRLEVSVDKWVENQEWTAPVLGGASFERREDLFLPLLETDNKNRFNQWLEAMTISLRKKMPKLLRKVRKFIFDNVLIGVITFFACLGAHLGSIEKFTSSSYLVCWVTSVVLILLIRGMPAEGVLVSATLFLTICGILTPEDAWAAFANDVVLSVAGLGCVAVAVGGTGVIDIVFTAILGKPESVKIAMLRLFLPSVFLNVCISNTCVMSCLLPVLDKWSVEIGFHRALFLAPLSYVLLISGVFAVFSTSTNLIAQGLLVSHHQQKLEEFGLSVPVMCCTAVTIVYLMIATPVVLKRFQIENQDNEDGLTSSSKDRRLASLTYDIRAQIVGKVLKEKTVKNSGLLERLGGHIESIVTCERYGELYGQVTEDFALELDDVFLLKTSAEGIIKIRDMAGVLLLPLDSSEAYVGASGWQSRELVEVVINDSCRMVTHRMVNSRQYFPRSNDCSIVAYRSFTEQTGKIQDKVKGGSARQLSPHGLSQRGSVVSSAADLQEALLEVTPSMRSRQRSASVERVGSFREGRRPSIQDALLSLKDKFVVLKSGDRAADLPERRVQKGDQIIFDAPTDFYQRYKESSDFVFVRRITKVPTAKPEIDMGKAYCAGFIMFGMILLVASATLPLLEAVLAALTALIMTQCTSLDTVLKAVKLSTVLTIVGAFGLGKAIGQQGVADALADLLLWLLEPFGIYGLLSAIFAATVALGVVFHGTAVVVLMYPICQQAALKTNSPIHQVVSVLCIAVSCQMLSPISYQTNLMAYSAGGYQFADFTKLGSGLVCVLALVAIPLCEHWYRDGPLVFVVSHTTPAPISYQYPSHSPYHHGH
jgi:di/tricarboxylate transporter